VDNQGPKTADSPHPLARTQAIQQGEGRRGTLSTEGRLVETGGSEAGAPRGKALHHGRLHTRDPGGTQFVHGMLRAASFRSSAAYQLVRVRTQVVYSTTRTRVFQSRIGETRR
jgi:hypothetical protein